MTFNEKFTLFKITQEKDSFGGIVQTLHNSGTFWCGVVKSDGYFKDIKGGKKRIQTLTLQTWINREIDHTCIIEFNNIRYHVVNALHSRKNGTTFFNCEFNN